MQGEGWTQNGKHSANYNVLAVCQGNATPREAVDKPHRAIAPCRVKRLCDYGIQNMLSELLRKFKHSANYNVLAVCQGNVTLRIAIDRPHRAVAPCQVKRLWHTETAMSSELHRKLHILEGCTTRTSASTKASKRELANKQKVKQRFAWQWDTSRRCKLAGSKFIFKHQREVGTH